MKRKLLQRRFICALIIFTICLGVLSQGMCAFAANSDKNVKRKLSSYSEDEFDAMTQEEYLALQREEEGISLSEDQVSENNKFLQPKALPAKSVANAVFFRSFTENIVGQEPNLRYECM